MIIVIITYNVDKMARKVTLCRNIGEQNENLVHQIFRSQ